MVSRTRASHTVMYVKFVTIVLTNSRFVSVTDERYVCQLYTNIFLVLNLPVSRSFLALPARNLTHARVITNRRQDLMRCCCYLWNQQPKSNKVLPLPLFVFVVVACRQLTHDSICFILPAVQLYRVDRSR